ncbi:MAG: nitroreductase family deazaflavin-dependent oxidoreductase [Chloroflexi bacterium]|nr:nitroreductase family deazaflavin-dependent oxidoreductase [Chloroflexota bacterium]
MSNADKRMELAAKFSRFAPYRLNILIYRLTGGRLFNKTPGGNLKILLLTTTGRKSGIQRTHPVMYYPNGRDFIVAATNSGNDKLPLWYLNLKTSPNAVVEVGSLKTTVSAREASGEERASLWNILREEQPVFKVYEKLTERTIPVVILHTAENP